MQDVAEEEDEEEENKNWYTYQTMNLNKIVISNVVKQWPWLIKEATTYNHLISPTTIYNHLEKFNNHLQPPQRHLQSNEYLFKQAINV